jgi:large subunit ribosomal protein L28
LFTNSDVNIRSLEGERRSSSREIENSKMSKVCQLTGKRPISGNNVSHSNRRTKRRFEPNLQKKRFYIPEIDKWVTLRISTKAMRNINKLGLYAYLKKLEGQGVNTGVDLSGKSK